jgi:hypothetical protein
MLDQSPIIPGLRILCRDAEWLVTRVEVSEVYHRVIISLDTLKNVARYEHFLKDIHQDVVIIEARDVWDEHSPLTVSWPVDNELRTVTKTFYPPFTRIDREADYACAYEVFKKWYEEGKPHG